MAASSIDARDGNVAMQKAKKATTRATECHGGGASFSGTCCGGGEAPLGDLTLSDAAVSVMVEEE